MPTGVYERTAKHRHPCSDATRAKISTALRGRPSSRRGIPQKAEVGYTQTHRWLRRHFPKTGVCERCGATGCRTEYSFNHHPEPHTRPLTEEEFRADYEELCVPCHGLKDRRLGVRIVGTLGWRKLAADLGLA